jgi:hypothetical protein
MAILPSSGSIDMGTIKSYLNLNSSSSINLNGYDVRRIRSDKQGIPVSQNPINLDQFHGANVLTNNNYFGSPGYVYGAIGVSVSPGYTNWNEIVNPGTYGVGDGSGWSSSFNGPVGAAYVYGQVYVKVEANTTTITQIFYRAYAPNDHWIRYRNPSGVWTAWEHFVL